MDPDSIHLLLKMRWDDYLSIYIHIDYKQLTVIHTAVKNVQYRVDFEVLKRLDF